MIKQKKMNKNNKNNMNKKKGLFVSNSLSFGPKLLELKTHPIIENQGHRTFGQKAADNLTKFAGSWTFIILFFIFLFSWMVLNSYIFIKYALGNVFDPYPYILLNLFLSCLAAIQAPIILMSQNRSAQRDRIRAEYDYQVNRRSWKEIQELKKQLIKIDKKLK